MTRLEQLHTRLLGDPYEDFRESPRPGLHRLDPRRLGLGWLGPLLFMLVGGVMRFWHVGAPHKLVFDETYYVKQGWSVVTFGHEMAVDQSLAAAKQVDQHFTANDPFVWGTVGDFVVHPPFGKWVIGLGESLFGIENSFGWRFSVALLGTLSILLIGRIARRLFRSDLMGTVAAALLAFEGHHFVQSRTGLLDTVVMFTGLVGFGCLLIDRDAGRAVLARRMAAWPTAPEGTRAHARQLFLGPGTGWRPWRWAAGVALGLCAGAKWSGLYWIAAFGLMTVLWDMGARRAAGVRGWYVAWLPRDAVPAFVQVAVTSVVTYVACWSGWILSTDGWGRTWAAEHPNSGLGGHVPEWLRSLWHYHAEMLSATNRVTQPHPYQSNPWSWIVQGRPTSFFYEGPKAGQEGCTVAQCSKAIASMGTVSVWWLGAASILVMAFMWVLARDWRAGAILLGLLAGWVPWMFLGNRTIYAFYQVAFVPYVVLGCTYVLGLLVGGRDATWPRRRMGLAVTGLFVAGTILIFWWFWPIYTAQVIPLNDWQQRMWFPSWI